MTDFCTTLISCVKFACGRQPHFFRGVANKYVGKGGSHRRLKNAGNFSGPLLQKLYLGQFENKGGICEFHYDKCLIGG